MKLTHWSNGQEFTYVGMMSDPASHNGRKYPGYCTLISESGKVIHVRADRVMVLAATNTVADLPNFSDGPF